MGDSPLVVSIPKGGIEITLYTPQESPKTQEYIEDNFLSRCISIRSIFVLLFLLSVILTSVSLIVTSYNGQLKIVETTTKYRILDTNQYVLANIRDLFSWLVAKLQSNDNLFYYYSIPPNNTNLLENWPTISEILWSAAKEQPLGANLQFLYPDTRAFGSEFFPQKKTIYYVNESTILSAGWLVNASIPILANNLSREAAYLYDYASPPDEIQFYQNMQFLLSIYGDVFPTCESPISWDGVSGRLICNQYGEKLGYLYAAVAIDSFDDVLSDLAVSESDYFFIMDTDLQMVASSTSSPTFVFTEDKSDVARVTVSTTDEWIKETYKNMKSDLRDRNYDIITINNTNQSIIISVVIAVVVVGVTILVTYIATKPLSDLAKNMQKISRLDLDAVKQLDSPMLIEVKRLYRSYLGMNAALRSFKKFVPAQIISKIIRSNKEAAAELKFRSLTVMFQDIEGFTTLSETMNPAALAKLTSEYMELMTTIICKHGGVIDKYVGGAKYCIMSLFNAPEQIEDHSAAAARSAVECIQVLVDKNKEWKEKYGHEMNFRTGIHSGEVLIGNMGSDNRMNYTAFGDNVNIAARLEGVNKLYGTRIVISKTVYKNFPEGQFITRKLGKIRVSGKSMATTIFEVIGIEKPTTKQLIKSYENALLAAKENRLDEALMHIGNALELEPTDKASLHLQQRLNEGLLSLDNWSFIEDLVKY